METIDPLRLDLTALHLAPDAHKGSRGSVGILGGAPGMVGAAWLAGRAALHAGAGRVYVGQIDPAAPVVDPLYPELMLRGAVHLLDGWSGEEASVPSSSIGIGRDEGDGASRLPLTALVAGPGMGAAPSAAELLAQSLETPLPLLLDADALNLLARRADLADRLRGRVTRGADAASTIITPHPAEAARLLDTTTDAVQADRPAAARMLAERYGAVVVLKGAGTLVAWPVMPESRAGTSAPLADRGRSDAVVAAPIRLAINPTGSNRLATAGTGDVLSGLIGALLARGLRASEAAQLGAWMHGRAGECMSDKCPTASGLLGQISSFSEGLLPD